jgi:hypothetical protein
MSTDRTAAIALVAGSLAGLVTMALHPTGRDVVHSASGASYTLATGVHVLAMLAQPLLLAGTVALTLRLRARRDVAVGAYAFFALASVAVVIAAAASGLLAPAFLQGVSQADESERAVVMAALHYTAHLNQAFAMLYVMFSGVAILGWSGAMLAGRELSRALAVYGLVLGAALLLGLASGHLRLNIHGFGAVMLGEAVWMAWVAAHLWRTQDS